jgi:putative ABC transport system permease protein
VIGIAIGVVGALIVGKLGDLPVELNAKVVMLAAAFSIGTGLFLRLLPARKASQLDPIEALRSQ